VFILLYSDKTNVQVQDNQIRVEDSRPSKESNECNPFNKTAMEAFHIDSVNKTVSINGKAASVGLGSKLHKYKIKNTFKSLIKSKKIDIDTLLNQKWKKLITEPDESLKSVIKQSGSPSIPKVIKEQEVQTDSQLPPINANDYSKNIQAYESPNHESMFLSDKLISQKSRDFRSITYFECSTVHEINLMDAIEDSLKTLNNHPNENWQFVDSEQDDEKIIDQISELYSQEALKGDCGKHD
jgi:hypothetical protein